MPVGAGLGVVSVFAAITAQYVGRHFPQTWWFRSDSIHIQRGPFSRRIEWEAIRRWQLTPTADHPGSHVLTIWHGDREGERASTIMVPPDTAPGRIEQVLQGYGRAV